MRPDDDILRDAGLVGATPRAVTPTTLAALVLAIVGLIFGLMADASASLAPLFALATVAAFNTRSAVLFAALTLVAGLGTLPAAHAFDLSGPFVGALAAGLALGLLGRELSAQLDHGQALSRPTLIALAALGLALTFLLPDAHVQLAAGDGSTLTFDALLVDPSTAIRMLRPIPAYIAHASPLSDVDRLALILAGITAFAALATAVMRQPADRILLAVARGTASVAGLVALVALGELLFAHVALDGEALRRTLSFEGRAPILDLAVPASGELRLWSRPMVDGLRIIAALILVAATFAPTRIIATAPTLRWLPLSLAAAALALLAAMPPLAWAGGLVVGLGALVVARMDHRSELIVRLAMLFMLVVWLWGAIATAPRTG